MAAGSYQRLQENRAGDRFKVCVDQVEEAFARRGVGIVEADQHRSHVVSEGPVVPQVTGGAAQRGRELGDGGEAPGQRVEGAEVLRVLPLAQQVDGGWEHVDGAGGDQGPHDGQVGVGVGPRGLGKAFPEGAPPELVAGEPVGEQGCAGVRLHGPHARVPAPAGDGQTGWVINNLLTKNQADLK